MTIPSENLKKFTEKYKYLRNFTTIKFPIFKLDGEPMTVHNVVFDNGQPIDDLNIEAPTLGVRRIKSKIDFKKLNKACLDMADLINSLKGQDNWFIDNFGTAFKYVRTDNQKVITHKVKKFIKLETHSIVFLEGIDYPFFLPRPVNAKYARVLYYKHVPWIILGYTNEFYKSTFKKV